MKGCFVTSEDCVVRKKRVGVDIDGTLAIIESVNDWYSLGFFGALKVYESAVVNEKLKKVINKLFGEGFEIVLFTSRRLRFREVTEKWLLRNGVKYDLLIMEKPYFEVLIDDKTLTPELASENRIRRFLK